MSELIVLSKQNGVGVITVNNPPVNALSPGVPEGIAQGLKTFATDDEVKAIVLIGGGRTFIAGADIKEFGKITSGQKRESSLLPLMLAMEDSAKPVVVAIHGTAFGGGLEVAMGGHFRVASPSALVGQPEVKLGIIPGAAGTQRLPRLAGIAVATTMCAFGEPLKAAAAHAAGIVDRIIEGDLLTGAVDFALEVAASGGPYPKPRERQDKLGTAETNAIIFAEARATAKKSHRNQTAPLAAIDAVELATSLPFDEGCKREREIFEQCLFSTQSKGMIHAFFGEREVAKIPGIGKETPVREIKKAAVIGAGTMGGGITMNFVNAGIPVILKESSSEALESGVATIRKNYANSVAKGRFSAEVMEQRMALITPQLTYDGFEQADIITEAVFEGMALKKEIFSALDSIAKPGCILASNTSTLSIDEIASVTKRPADVIGTHYFSPANVMRLLEIVRGEATGSDVIATCMGLAKKLNKVGVLVGNCRGFVGNRMIHCYGREAQFLVEEGAVPQQVDAALYNWGMAMGPLAMGDLAGLDVGWRIRKEFKHLEKPGVRVPLVADELCEMGRFGQKTGAGWYLYDEKRKPSPDPVVNDLIAKLTAQAGIQRRSVSDEEIIERTLYALVNEGARILEEKIALRPVDIDIIYLTGYGFPAYRGGPMFYADTIGLPEVYRRILEFETQHGELWEPAPLLKKLANEEKTFMQWAKESGV